jgi:hypothetical protein
MDLQQIADEVASDVVLQLIVDGHIVVSPLSVPAVELRVAMILREALQRVPRGFLQLARERDELDLEAGVLGLTTQLGRKRRPFLSVVEDIVRAIRSSPEVQRVCADDDTLLRKILSVIALLGATPRRAVPIGGTGSPPPSPGPAGGNPAEVRAWEVRRGETPPEPDPERRERSKRRWRRKR